MRNSLNILFCLYMFDGLSLEGEEWRNYKNSSYWGSSKGRLLTTNWKNTGKTSIMSSAKNNDEYMCTVFVLNNQKVSIRVHRVIAELFIDNSENKTQVNHINEVKYDNRVENLEWCTPRENFWHSEKKNKVFLENVGKKENLKHLKGEQIGTSILTDKDVLQIREKFIPYKYTRKILAKEYNVAESTIKDIILKKSWKHL